VAVRAAEGGEQKCFKAQLPRETVVETAGELLEART